VPGPIETGMLDRFTGGEAGKAWMTEQVPARHLGHVDEIAVAIVFVAIGKATCMTGQSISVAGGITA
jgi:NAD(P)-dependent dehydrogenase (short-subunit alcohol dehydrogenase family)